MAKAIAQFTITDFNDVNISTTQPSAPVTDMLWLDISVTPNQLKRYSGSSWNIVNDVQGQINDVITRVTTAETKITPSAIVSTVRTDTNYINDQGLKVNKSTIISEINQSAEAISISASKLNLTGYATFSSLSTAGATTINGANITTGTINANNVTISGSRYIMDANGFRQINGFSLTSDNQLNCADGRQFHVNYSSGADLVVGSGTPGTKGNLFVRGVYFSPFSTTNCNLQSGDQAVQINSEYGYVQIGAKTGTYANLITDRVEFHFSTGMKVAGHVMPYSNNAYYCGYNTTNAWKSVSSYALVNVSDKSVKKNIMLADKNTSYETIKSMNIYNYNYKNDTRLMMGIMADEAPIETVEQENFNGVNIYSLLALAINGLQESIAKIEVLETEVAKLGGIL